MGRLFRVALRISKFKDQRLSWPNKNKRDVPSSLGLPISFMYGLVRHYWRCCLSYQMI